MISPQTRPKVDVVIVGGGPAGLSAALVLGRCRRRVLLCDAGNPRNYAAREMHGYLGRDCSDPADLRREGREQLARYDNVEVNDIAVEDAQPEQGGFAVRLADGSELICRKLLLASGIKDTLPDVRGFEEIYGISGHHCPYCDGWEFRDQALAVYGQGAMGRGLALELLGWSRDLILFTDGPAELSEQERRELGRNEIELEEGRIRELQSEGGRLQAVHLEDGRSIRRSAFFFATPTEQSCALASGLGCEFNDRGSVRTGTYEKTNVTGLYVAGDASHHVELAIVAAAEGAMAAFAINTELLEDDRA